jgi:predicted PhzF superfamily epimerase YddE/YHI9
MPRVHVVRVFVGPGDAGGNELGVFLDGAAIPRARRLAAAASSRTWRQAIGLGVVYD